MRKVAAFIGIIVVVGAIAYFFAFKPDAEDQNGGFLNFGFGGQKDDETTKQGGGDDPRDDIDGNPQTKIGQVKEARLYYDNPTESFYLKVILKSQIPGWAYVKKGQLEYNTIELVGSTLANGYFPTITTYNDGFDLVASDDLIAFFKEKAAPVTQKIINSSQGNPAAMAKISAGVYPMPSPFVGSITKGYLKLPQLNSTRIYL